MTSVKAIRIFEQAITRPPDQQRRFVDEQCDGDTALRSEVIELLEMLDLGQRLFPEGSVTFTAEDTPASQAGEPCIELSAGTIIDRYVLTEAIGSGGMGAVYRARDTILARDVALKLLPEHIAGDDEATTALLREAQAAGSLNHPNVISLHTTGYHEGALFLVMELATGGTVEQVLQYSESSTLVVDATRIIQQACEGLAVAHDSGCVHRDVKPENLLVGEHGIVKVADFGIARFVSSNTQAEKNAVIGTPYYMSPEQCFGRKTDLRSDIYSLGATYYQLLTGQKPYADRDNAMQVMYAHCHDPPIDPRAVRNTIPDACARVVMRAMSKDPTERYQHCREMSAELSQIVDDAAGSRSGVIDMASASRVWKDFSRIPSGPRVAVLPLSNLSTDADQEFFSDGVTEEIRLGLSRFRELAVVASSSAFQYKNTQIDVREVARELGAEYVVTGSVQRHGHRIRINVQLVNSADDHQVWAEVYDRDLNTADLLDIQDDVSQRVAAAVGCPGGLALQQRQRVAIAKDAATLGTYELVLRWYEYSRTSRQSLHGQLRDRFEALTDSGSMFADAWAVLALLYLDEVRAGFNRRSGASSLDLAGRAAKQAIGMDPNSGLAASAMASVHFHREEFGEFRYWGQRALRLNPSHPDFLGGQGLYLWLLGEWEKGVALTEKAIALTPCFPAWYHMVPLLENLRLEQYESALVHARQVSGVDASWTYEALAVCHGLLGNVGEATRAAEKLLQTNPEFPGRWKEEYAVRNFPDPIVETMRRGLAAAGVELRE